MGRGKPEKNATSFLDRLSQVGTYKLGSIYAGPGNNLLKYLPSRPHEEAPPRDIIFMPSKLLNQR